MRMLEEQIEQIAAKVFERLFEAKTKVFKEAW